MFSKLKEFFNEIYYKILENPLFEQIKQKYNSFTDREKKVANFGVIFLLFLAIFSIFQNLYEGISNKDKEITVLSNLIEDLDELIRINKVIQSRNPGRKLSDSKYVSLLDLIEQQENLSLIKSTSRVEIKEEPRKEVDSGKFYESRAKATYNKITLKQLHRFIEGIEKNAVTVNVNSLIIKRNTEDLRYIDTELVLLERTPK